MDMRGLLYSRDEDIYHLPFASNIRGSKVGVDQLAVRVTGSGQLIVHPAMEKNFGLCVPTSTPYTLRLAESKE